MGAFASIWQTVAYVVSFWYIKLFGWWRSQPPKAMWMTRLRNATTYEDWEAAALQLDKLHGFDLWRETSQSKHYDWSLIKDRLQLLHDTRVDPAQHHRLPNLIRSGLVRNLGNITSPKLYNCSFAGTKLIIEEYIAQVIFAIDDFLATPITAAATSPSRRQPASPAVDEESCGQPTDDRSSQAPGAAAASTGAQAALADAAAPRPAPTSPALSMQAKMTFIHDTRQAFGRTSLILQGGSIFGMCHLGVVKALFLRGLLPQVITGTAVGALIAALVAVHTDEELPGVLSGDAIDLSAFTPTSGKSTPSAADADSSPSIAGSIAGLVVSVLCACAPLSSSSTRRWMTLLRRLRRFTEKGYFLDVDVLERCVRDNVGELTFQEAFRRTGRVLNITVATAEQGGVPTVLNHITSPHVVRSSSLSLPSPSSFSPRARILNATQPNTADLDRRGRLQRRLPLPVRAGDAAALQAAQRRDRALGPRKRHQLPPLDRGGLRRAQLAAPAHRRALQRQQLRHQPGPPLRRALPAARHARPDVVVVRLWRRRRQQRHGQGLGRRRPRHLDPRLLPAPGRARGPPPPPPARPARPAAHQHPPLPRRRPRPRRRLRPHPRARGARLRLCPPARGAHARRPRVLDPHWREERLARPVGPRGALRHRDEARLGLQAHQAYERQPAVVAGCGGGGTGCHRQQGQQHGRRACEASERWQGAARLKLSRSRNPIFTFLLFSPSVSCLPFFLYYNTSRRGASLHISCVLLNGQTQKSLDALRSFHTSKRKRKTRPEKKKEKKQQKKTSLAIAHPPAPPRGLLPPLLCPPPPRRLVGPRRRRQCRRLALNVLEALEVRHKAPQPQPRLAADPRVVVLVTRRRQRQPEALEHVAVADVAVVGVYRWRLLLVFLLAWRRRRRLDLVCLVFPFRHPLLFISRSPLLPRPRGRSLSRRVVNVLLGWWWRRYLQ
ncbi:hypothetical protein RB595_007573 [Gaeumannomyces hyphopodioides]